MALSPSIPTSFVPKQPVSTGNRRYSSGNNIFLIVSLVILGVVLLLALGVFLYSTYLGSVEKKEGAQLLAAQNNASIDTVDQFVRLRDRLTAAKTVMNQHIVLSQFFTELESVTLQDVQFTNMKITVADDRSAKVSLDGTAKTFNALAAESSTFAAQKNIKDAIFSGITVNKDGSVSFMIDADLDPNLVIEQAAPTTPALLPGAAASTTPILLPATVTTSGSSTPSTPSTPIQDAGSAATTSALNSAPSQLPLPGGNTATDSTP